MMDVKHNLGFKLVVLGILAVYIAQRMFGA